MSSSSASSRRRPNHAAPFAAVPPFNRLDLPALEREWLARWEAAGTVERYLHRNDAAPERYRFIDGPITANNQMGVHHAWGRAYKDLYQRFQTMRGRRQRYQNGFDCQGLWVEVEVEREFGFRNKHDIEEYGIAAFVERCKERVLRFAGLITEQSQRLGYWMRWDDSYFTMSDENNYTIWHFLKVCYERGLLYKGRDSMPWCPRCATGISDMEINEGRKEVTHTSLYVRFPLVGRDREYLLVWTTTPWTLPANVAAAVNPDLTYARVTQDGDTYYLSKDLLSKDLASKLAKLRGHEHGAFEVVGELPGADLVGWEYAGPYDELPAWSEAPLAYAPGITPRGEPRRHHVVAWKDVAANEGTGIVHIAPGCGREDFALGKDEGLRILAPLDENGVYVAGYGWLSGQEVGDVGRPIMDDLRRKGLLYQTESVKHVYPHCWRCGTELIFRNVEEWFITMGPKNEPERQGLRYAIMDVVAQIHWLPEFGLERELDWLRNMEDWMISKKRYWGLALPIYDCAACGHFEVIGSEHELQRRAVAGWDEFAGHTPHRPYVDAVTIRCAQCGAVVERIKDVGNPWLDAGIVPYSTLNYRSDRDYWQAWFPADFITESFPGQFRNWFYSMLVMSTVLENAPPFKTVLGFATARAFDGSPMSKSKGTAVWFTEAVERVGADTMRWLYAAQPPEQDVSFPLIPTAEQMDAAAAQGVPVRVNDDWQRVRTTLDKLWNVYYFFVTYANIDRFDPSAHRLPGPERADVDRWLLSELQATIDQVTQGLEAYDAVAATTAISAFVDQLSNWYIRRVREHFWKSELDAEKIGAYLTLYEALETLARLLAPITPFLAEAIFTNLVRGAESVHLADWPTANPALVARELEAETRLIQRVVNLGRAAREQARLRVRQPLAALYVRVADEDRPRLVRLQAQALDELNVKALHFLPPESDMLTATLKPRMAALGQKYRARMQDILRLLKDVPPEAAYHFHETGQIALTLPDGAVVTLTPAEVEAQAGAKPGYVAAEDRGLVVVLETTLTPDLEAEGLVRDLTHQINALRKQADFAIADHIALRLVTDADLAAIIERFAAVVRAETLADALTVHADLASSGGEAILALKGQGTGEDTAILAVKGQGTDEDAAILALKGQGMDEDAAILAMKGQSTDEQKSTDGALPGGVTLAIPAARLGGHAVMVTIARAAPKPAGKARTKKPAGN